MSLSDRDIKQLLEKAESLIESGRRADSAGDVPFLKQALDCYNKIIQNAPPHPHYFRDRAEIKYKLACRSSLFGLDEAIKDINVAVELDPQQQLYYLRRGEYSLEKLANNYEMPRENRRRLLEEIISDYKFSLEKNPSAANVWLGLIVAHILQYDYDNAISLYGSCRPYVTESEGQIYRSWLGCLALALAGDPIEEEDKKPLYNRLLCPSFNVRISIITSFLNEIRLVEDYRGKWKEAFEIHELLVSHLAAFDRAYVFGKFNEYEKALVEIDKVLEMNPDNSVAWNNKGYYLASLKRYEEALKPLDKAIKLDPHSVRAWGNKAWALESLKRYREALETNEKAMQLNPMDAIVWTRKGWCLENLGHYHEAVQVFDKAIELEPTHPRPWFNKGFCLQQLNKYDEAVAYYEKAIELNHPVTDLAWNNIGWSFEKLGHYEEAIEAYDKALKLNPNQSFAMTNKRNLLERIK